MGAEVAGEVRAAIEAALARHAPFRDAVAAALPALLSPDAPTDRPAPPLDTLPGHIAHAVVRAVAGCPNASLEVSVRALGLHVRPALAGFLADVTLSRYAEVHGPIDVAHLLGALASEKLEDEHVLTIALARPLAFDAASVVRLAAARPEELSRALDDGAPWDREARRQGLLRLLEATRVAPELATAFLHVALGAPRDVAVALRRALAGIPTAAIAERLGDRAWATRAAAAAWLAERHDAAALPALRGALAKEKHEEAMGAIVTAIESCGGAWEPDRAALGRAAERALAKGWPDELAFLTREPLPRLSWRDGTEVEERIVKGWILQAYARRDPRPLPLVRLAARALEPTGRRALAQTLLDRFVAWDTRPVDPLSADQEDRLVLLLDAGRHGTREELLARVDASNLGLPTASAIACKGVLGLVASLGDDGLAPALEAYVRTHRGFRAAQSRAMLTVLAHLETPRATQALLQIAARFRTPGLRKEALLLADELAGRRGWTLADLADRTVGAAGLDEHGRLELAYGTTTGAGEDAEVIATRRFVAQLDEHDELVLRDERGATLAKLPEPRAGEDAALAAREKKRWTAARKELRAILSAQRARLYEAMLAERSWPRADFVAFFLAHPVLGRLVRRLLWSSDGPGVPRTFRVAEDGTLVSAGLDEVRLEEDAQVRIAHAAHLDGETVRAWQEHLADHRTLPLFEQLDRPPVPASAWSADHTGVLGARTRVLARTLRGRAERAGYVEVRGDGGYLERFERTLPTIGRALVLDTEGLEPIAAADTEIEVIGLRWTERRPSQAAPTPLPWSEASEVVRREAWADLRSLST